MSGRHTTVVGATLTGRALGIPPTASPADTFFTDLSFVTLSIGLAATARRHAMASLTNQAWGTVTVLLAFRGTELALSNLLVDLALTELPWRTLAIIPAVWRHQVFATSADGMAALVKRTFLMSRTRPTCPTVPAWTGVTDGNRDATIGQALGPLATVLIQSFQIARAPLIAGSQRVLHAAARLRLADLIEAISHAVAISTGTTFGSAGLAHTPTSDALKPVGRTIPCDGLGLGATPRVADHHLPRLAAPEVWPANLIVALGLIAILLCRTGLNQRELAAICAALLHLVILTAELGREAQPRITPRSLVRIIRKAAKDRNEEQNEIAHQRP